MTKTNYIRVRVTDEMLAEIQRVAAKDKRTISDWVRLTILERTASINLKELAEIPKKKKERK